MMDLQTQQPTPIILQPKTPIKNMHQIKQLKLHKNSQIYVIYNSVIHVHLISKLQTHLPSLVHVIELHQIVDKVERGHYQDGFSYQVATKNKSQFGGIVFGGGSDGKARDKEKARGKDKEKEKEKDNQKDREKDNQKHGNKLLDVGVFQGRIRYLGSDVVRVKDVSISVVGHLLVAFEDWRCILLKRNNPMSIDINYTKMFDIQSPILVNTLLQSAILSTIFQSSPQLCLICLHKSSRTGNQLKLSFLKESQQDHQQNQLKSHQKQKPLQIAHTIQQHKIKISERGFRSMSYVENGEVTGSGWVLILYYDRLEVIEIGTTGSKRGCSVVSHKLADFNDQEKSNQHVINSWQYYSFSKDELKVVKYYLLKSTSIWQLQITFKTQHKNMLSKQRDRQKYKHKQNQIQQLSQSSWYYKLNILQKQPLTKSNVYFINYAGRYLEHPSQAQMLLSQPASHPYPYPNHQQNLAIETDNGLLIKLQSSPNNYKEGYLYLMTQSPVYMVEKAIYSLKEKMYGYRDWVDFGDLVWIRKHADVKKAILKELTKVMKSKELGDDDKQMPVQYTQGISNKLIINLLLSLDSKPHIAKNLSNYAIKKQLKLSETQKFNPSHCSITNKKITIQDLLYCNRCHLYSINFQNNTSNNNSIVNNNNINMSNNKNYYCCYVCWNFLYRIQ